MRVHACAGEFVAVDRGAPNEEISRACDRDSVQASRQPLSHFCKLILASLPFLMLILASSALADTATSQPTDAVYLASMRETAVKCWTDPKGRMVFHKRVSDWEGTPISVNGERSPNGLFTHPPAQGSAIVRYALDGKYQSFTTEVGIADDSDPPPQSKVTFKVIGDGKALWTSKPFDAKKKTDSCSVSIKGIKELQLIAEASASNYFAHAVWLEPRVSSAAVAQGANGKHADSAAQPAIPRVSQDGNAQDAMPKEDLDAVRRILRDRDPDIRARALMTLADASSPEATDLLIASLKDYEKCSVEDGYVNWAAIKALGHRKEKKAVDALVPLLAVKTVRIGGGTQEWDASGLVAESLAQIGDRDAVPAIIAAITSRHAENIKQFKKFYENKQINEHAGQGGIPRYVIAHVQALGQLKDTKAVSCLNTLLRANISVRLNPLTTGKEAVYRGDHREAIYAALKQLPCDETTDVLVAMLASPPTSDASFVRATTLLRLQKDQRAVKPLITSLKQLGKASSKKSPTDQDLFQQKQREAILNALAGITGQAELGDDPQAWAKWYSDSGLAGNGSATQPASSSGH